MAFIALGMTLAGCAPTVAVRSSMEGGTVPVAFGGQDFVADLHQGRSGKRLTQDGAVPTYGMAVTVARDDGRAVRDFAGAPMAPSAAPIPDPALGQADGRLAKGAAQAACAASGGRFDPAAVGRVSAAGRWTFEGACS